MSIRELIAKLRILSKYLLVYENYILYTKLSEEEIFARISNISDNDYFQRIVKNQFQMYRHLDYRNDAALPFLQGTLFPEKEATFISIRIRLHPVSKLIMGLFIIMPFILFIVSKFELLKLNRKVPPEILIGPFFIYAVLLYFFKSESKIIKSFIRQLLDAKG